MGHCTIYFEKKVYFFDSCSLYIYDKSTKEFKDFTGKVKGNLIYLRYGTSTVVNENVINTNSAGT